MFNQHNLFYPASHGKRFVAFILDTLVATVVAQLMMVILRRSGFAFDISGVFVTFYFVIFQSTQGFTPGKKLMGLRVINAGFDEKASFLKNLGRETIGRFLAMVVLLFGYILIFFDKDHQGLHDKIFKTQVVSDEPDGNGSSLILFAQAFGVLVLIFTGSLYTLLYTTLPLKAIAQNMEQRGFQFEEIRGNLKKGFSIGKLQFSNENVDFLGQDLVFQYASIFDLLKGDEVHIQQISSSMAEITIKQIGGQKQDRQNPSPDLASERPRRARKDMRLVLDQLDIAEMKVTYPGQKTFLMKRFNISNAQIDRKNMEIEKIWLDSDKLFANIERTSFSIEKKLLKIYNADVILRKAAFPDTLAGDADFKLQLSGDFTAKKVSGSVVAFRKSFFANFDDTSLDVKMTAFQPHWFFKNVPPVHSFNMNGIGPMSLAFLTSPFLGSYKLRNHDVTLGPKASLASSLGGEFKLGPVTVASSLSKNPAPDAQIPVILNLSSGGFEDLSGILSQIYFLKKPSDLNESEKALLTDHSRYFTFQKPGFIPTTLRSPSSYGK